MRLRRTSASSWRLRPARLPVQPNLTRTRSMRLDRTSFGKRLGSYAESISLPAQPVVEGRLLRMVGLTLEAEGLRAAMGSSCVVINDDSHHPVEVEAEVMGFSGGKVFLMPVGSVAGI
ncbi:Flagellum-specific ATP synthase FliI, partial [Pseudomonas amygdali pv. lachrymans]